jgi:hypothetical protein
MAPWEFLNSKFGLLVVGFILTTLLGGVLSSWLQNASWKRQMRVDLFRKRYEEGTQLLDDLSDNVGRRFFAMQRFLWSLADPTSDKCQNIEAEYFKIVGEWNASLRTYRNKIRLLISEEHADRFLDYRDDLRPEDPSSLHYIFVRAHNAVMQAKARRIAVDKAQVDVTELNWRCSTFLEVLTTAFLERATSLRLLEIPKLRQSRTDHEGN